MVTCMLQCVENTSCMWHLSVSTCPLRTGSLRQEEPLDMDPMKNLLDPVWSPKGGGGDPLLLFHFLSFVLYEFEWEDDFDLFIQKKQRWRVHRGADRETANNPRSARDCDPDPSEPFSSPLNLSEPLRRPLKTSEPLWRPLNPHEPLWSPLKTSEPPRIAPGLVWFFFCTRSNGHHSLTHIKQQNHDLLRDGLRTLHSLGTPSLYETSGFREFCTSIFVKLTPSCHRLLTLSFFELVLFYIVCL